MGTYINIDCYFINGNYINMKRKKELSNIEFLITFLVFVGVLYTIPEGGLDDIFNGSPQFYILTSLFIILIIRWIR